MESEKVRNPLTGRMVSKSYLSKLQREGKLGTTEESKKSTKKTGVKPGPKPAAVKPRVPPPSVAKKTSTKLLPSSSSQSSPDLHIHTNMWSITPSATDYSTSKSFSKSASKSASKFTSNTASIVTPRQASTSSSDVFYNYVKPKKPPRRHLLPDAVKEKINDLDADMDRGYDTDDYLDEYKQRFGEDKFYNMLVNKLEIADEQEARRKIIEAYKERIKIEKPRTDLVKVRPPPRPKNPKLLVVKNLIAPEVTGDVKNIKAMFEKKAAMGAKMGAAKKTSSKSSSKSASKFSSSSGGYNQASPQYV